MLNRKKQDEDLFSDIDKLDKEEEKDLLGSDNNLDSNFDNLGGGGADMSPAIEKHGDLLKELTNFDPYIRELLNGWLGLVWDQEKEKFRLNPDSPPIMNVKCANWCIGFLKIYARKNNIITNLSQDEYFNIYHDIVEVLWLNLPLRHEEFGIKENGDIKKICVEMEHTAVLVLLGAGDGKYNKLLTETVNRTENISSSDNPMPGMGKKRSLLSNLKNIIN